MIKIRLEGLPSEVSEAVDRLSGIYTVLSVSDPYHNRGKSAYVRVYVEADLDGVHYE